jgi:hypothetical protein
MSFADPLLLAAPELARRAPPALAAHLLLAVAEGLEVATPDKARVLTTPLPMPAEVFHGTLSPMASATERTEMIQLVAGHEAHATVSLARETSAGLSGPEALDALRKATHDVARALPARPMALLWGPTRRLLHGPALLPLLRMGDPLGLYLAPVIEREGEDRRQVMRFLGSKARLGYGLTLDIGEMKAGAAQEAGLAFARAVLAEPELRDGELFDHDGQHFLTASDDDGREVTLVPISAPARPGAGSKAQPRASKARRPSSPKRSKGTT